jgi:hypothetical protein
MFDFFSSDTFTILLEIAFLVFIIYDLKRYFETKKREYMINVVLAFGFFIYAAIPFYNKYYLWSDEARLAQNTQCSQEEINICQCMNDKLFKAYSFEEYETMELNSDAYKEFLKESQEECKEE